MTDSETLQAYQIDPIIRKQREKIDTYLKQHYGKTAYNHTNWSDVQKSSTMIQYRKRLMERLFEEVVPKLVSETRYGFSLNKMEYLVRVKENFKQEAANAYWIFKKLVELRNWDYRSFLHVVDVYLFTHLYIRHNETAVKNPQAIATAALLINLGRLHIPKHVLQKHDLTKEERDILNHHALWSIELAKGNVTNDVANLLYLHYQQLHRIPQTDQAEEQRLAAKMITFIDQFSEMTLVGSNHQQYKAHQALEVLVTQKAYDKETYEIGNRFMQLLHIYPENCLVTLTNGVQATVQKVYPQIPYLPCIKELANENTYMLPTDLSTKIKTGTWGQGTCPS
ncbi:HD domain-containing phosphohydrolase [Aquibacillus sediminis]|uniref:HD domain-containing phosphohydrolase n=1 Tax=Aquibacillus sediminis TaxID=2574734 RepID=UPI00110872FE|nr:HD domain-containing phosphohydrolase [Aquibacillus sediminis]